MIFRSNSLPNIYRPAPVHAEPFCKPQGKESGSVDKPEKRELGVDKAASGVDITPVKVEPNPSWIDQRSRPACKYAPVIVSKQVSESSAQSMQKVLESRIDKCQELALLRGTEDGSGWFSFIRGGKRHQPHLTSTTVPAIVISGGSGNKVASELSSDLSLAWHPKNMRDEPVYLLVHHLDYETYAKALDSQLRAYPNLHLVGWNGGAMTGFGAARAAALAFADSLAYCPERVLMMDQDVVQTEETRHTCPAVKAGIEKLHKQVEKPVIGIGVGYPTRQPVPKPFSTQALPESDDYNSPAQQFVSIQSPFRNRDDDGIYPAYMVAGGEDMLMGLELGLNKEGRNTALFDGRIVKKALQGAPDTPNLYWNQARVDTLKALFEAEKSTLLEFEGEVMTLDELMALFVKKDWITTHPSADSYNVAACVIERIILRYKKSAETTDSAPYAVFNR